MTRDEAARRLREYCKRSVPLGNDWATLEVDKYVALGMLKLDEPKTGLDKFFDGLPMEFVEARLARLGLKIVEK